MGQGQIGSHGQYFVCPGLRYQCCLLSSCGAVKRLLVFNYVTSAKDWQSY